MTHDMRNPCNVCLDAEMPVDVPEQFQDTDPQSDDYTKDLIVCRGCGQVIKGDGYFPTIELWNEANPKGWPEND